jgi:hypothetical protein
MKKLFENWNKYLSGTVNEGIGMKNYEMLYQSLVNAYGDGMRSYRSDQQVGMPDGEYRPVDSDPHVEVVNSLVDLVKGMLDEIQERQRGEKDVG